MSIAPHPKVISTPLPPTLCSILLHPTHPYNHILTYPYTHPTLHPNTHTYINTQTPLHPHSPHNHSFTYTLAPQGGLVSARLKSPQNSHPSKVLRPSGCHIADSLSREQTKPAIPALQTSLQMSWKGQVRYQTRWVRSPEQQGCEQVTAESKVMTRAPTVRWAAGTRQVPAPAEGTSLQTCMCTCIPLCAQYKVSHV